MPRFPELDPQQLRRTCDPKELGFKTTRELEPPEGMVGQPRVEEALEFGIEMGHDGYNIFAFGPPGIGKHALVRAAVETRAARDEAPSDVCYVNNFDDSHKPRLLMLPTGKAGALRDDMERLVEELGAALRVAFESEEYQNQLEMLEEEFKERQQEAMGELGEEAKKEGLALLRTPMGFVFAPIGEEDVISPEEFEKLDAETRSKLENQIEEFQSRLQKVVRQFPRWQREAKQKTRELDQAVSGHAVEPLIEELKEKYADLEDVQSYLEAVQADVIDNARGFVVSGRRQGDDRRRGSDREEPNDEPTLSQRYQVNVLVEHTDGNGAPVVWEDDPSYPNLVGRIEHFQRMGALVTDFNLIKPGALHRANGGYLLLDAVKLLSQPYAWEGLKRALHGGEIKTRSLGQALSLISTYSLEPEPVPLSVKVVLLGAPRVYYLLAAYDPEFTKLFKVPADFAAQMDRSGDNLGLYSRLIAGSIRDEELRPFDAGAVARVIENGSRQLGDSQKMSLYASRLVDFLREADYYAGKNEAETVSADHVQRAIDARIRRSDRIKERVQEQIERGTVLLDTDGEVVGQVNGLSVLQLGDFAFGRPSRITARVRLGKGEVVNIDREVDLSGPLHSKGVLILSGFLGARYAADRPLSLSASLVFEQSYGGVDGDSASSTELYALLSAIAEIPLKQSLAVTGSINQRGQVQAIGGVNEKIEGFFDLCVKRGLTGEQGVLIPASNVDHLMLKHEVVEAVERGEFHIHPVEHVDQGIEILTGIEAGERDADGTYPEGSVNRRVAERLAELAKKARKNAAAGVAAAVAGGPEVDEEDPDSAG